MILGVISDTHDKLATIDTALRYFQKRNVEIVIHCGDWKTIETMAYFAALAHELFLPIRAVLGNRDTETDIFLKYAINAPGNFILSKDVLEIDSNSKKVVVTHGHLKTVVNDAIKNESVSMVLLGHSHKTRIERVNDTLIANPGSTAFSIPRSKLWKPSVAVVDTDAQTAEIYFLD